MKKVILFTVLIFTLNSSFTQKIVSVIPLDSSLEKISGIMQFSDQQGHILLKFRGNDYGQYSLLRQDSVIENRTLALDNKDRFLDCLNYDQHFSLLYRNAREQTIKVLDIGNAASNQFALSNIQAAEETFLGSSFQHGNFLVFSYSTAPFAIHTYTYKGGIYFDKKSQFLRQQKGEKFFLGQIRTEEEVIFVRLSLNNPFTLHFYRYFKDKGFEKKSVDMRPAYQAAGFKTKVVPEGVNFNASTPLSASILADNIYLNMEQLVHINPSLSKAVNLSSYPGILRLNWQDGDHEIISFDRNNGISFTNRSVALMDHLYFKLLVSKSQLDLSIFDIRDQELLKTYTYNRDQDISLIYDEAKLSKAKSINVNLSTVVSLPIGINRPKEKEIDSRTLLQRLAVGDLFMDAFSDGETIELRVTGVSGQTTFYDVNLTARFRAYLSQANLGIVNSLEGLEDKRYKEIDVYLNNLAQTNKEITHTIVYKDRDNIYLAYIDEAAQYCKIIAF